jgi:hypothetical protein
MTLNCSSLPAVLQTAETPADSKALIKHYSTRLVVTQCYSVVKNPPPCGVPPRWALGLHLPKVRHQATCASNRYRYFTVSLLMPNLGQLSVASIQLPVILTGPHSTDHSIRISGGADRDRTGDPLVANQVLSQLSYSPLSVASCQYLAASCFLTTSH